MTEVRTKTVIIDDDATVDRMLIYWKMGRKNFVTSTLWKAAPHLVAVFISTGLSVGLLDQGDVNEVANKLTDRFTDWRDKDKPCTPSVS